MKRRVLKILVMVVSLVTTIGTVAWFAMAPEKQVDAEPTICEWARVSSYSVSASSITVAVRGGMFTREFEVEMQMSEEKLAAWIASSPGFKDATTEKKDGVVIYHIKPGGGAQFAEIRVRGDHVTIRVFWS